MMPSQSFYILPVTVSDAVTVNNAVLVNCHASLVFETNGFLSHEETVVTNETLVTMTSDDETIIHPPSESSTPNKIIRTKEGGQRNMKKNNAVRRIILEAIALQQL